MKTHSLQNACQATHKRCLFLCPFSGLIPFHTHSCPLIKLLWVPRTPCVMCVSCMFFAWDILPRCPSPVPLPPHILHDYTSHDQRHTQPDMIWSGERKLNLVTTDSKGNEGVGRRNGRSLSRGREVKIYKKWESGLVYVKPMCLLTGT